MGKLIPRLICACAVFSLAFSNATADAANAAPNPSFEQGAPTPDAWRASSGAATGSGRTGQRSVGARTRAATRAWVSDTVALEAGQSYRLSGWVRCRQGAAVLGLDLLDASGRLLAAAHTPAVSSSAGWRYISVERDLPGQAARARLWFEVSGEAYLDDVALAPMVRNLVYNPGFDADARGRIGFWSQEAPEGAPGGSHRADPAGHSGPALLVEAGRGGWSVRCVPWPVVEGARAYRFAGWTRAQNAQPWIRVAWLDAWDRTLHQDCIEPAARGGEWTRCERRNLLPPRGAAMVTISAGVAGGKAWFDDFFFGVQEPARRKEPFARVLVNQVGYDLGAPKSAVVMSNFFPADYEAAHLVIHSIGGQVAACVPLRCAGRIHEGRPDDWGAYYWRADFSTLERSGSYWAQAHLGQVAARSPRFVIGRQALLRETGRLGVQFFFVQRCGFDVPGWHRACHLDDANLADGTHIDAVGGWHSAGDYNKIMYENGDGGVMYALLAAYLAQPQWWERNGGRRNGLPCILDEAWWGARFMAKMQIPESGGLRGHVSQGPGRAWMKWSPPETHTDNIVGTADDPVIAPEEGRSPLAVAGWACLSVLLRERGVENDYLERARRLWDHATGRGSAVQGGHLLISAVCLHRVTGEQQYLDAAQRAAASILSGQRQSGPLAGAFGSYGEVDAGALAFFALEYPDHPLRPEISAALRRWVIFCRSTADNPFGLSKQAVGEQDYFFEPTSALGRNWELLTRAWAALLCCRLNHDRRALRYAVDQIDWVLGKNPFGLCMFEGKGALNPPRYHHRYATIPGHERGAVPGCVPNGFVRSPAGLDQPGFDMSRPGPGKRPPSYRTSEPWLTHNLWFLMAVSEMAKLSATPQRH